MLTPDDLRIIRMFADLDDDALAWIAARTEEVRLAVGDVLVETGAPADWMFFSFSGLLRTVVRQGGRDVGTFSFETGDLGGMLPHSRMSVFPMHIEAVEPSRVGKVHKQHFTELLQRIPVLDRRLAQHMVDRVRTGTRVQLQQEKLASLGTMAAGLAHELNNPASAARRAAQRLRATLERFDQLAGAMLADVMFANAGESDPFAPIKAVLEEGAPDLDPITTSEREDDLADWLEDRDVEAPWDVAATLVAAGYTHDVLADVASSLRPGQLANFLNWLPRDVEMRQLADELTESTTRISDLVGAMKAYSFMDQANEKGPTDLNKGLENTLTILNHKRKRKAVEVIRAFGELPPVPAYGGELNQVWTNLLDNAIAAVPEEGGQIRIETCYDASHRTVQVDVIDNGSGIPAEIQGRIFEPFFTTKGEGEGTGLGLDIAYRIITDRHSGALFVSSVPGETRFHVRIPVGDTSAVRQRA